MTDKNFIFVSDLHLSEGFLGDENRYHMNEDFMFDDAFGRFLGYLQRRREKEGLERPWRLVILGDFLENLQITTFPAKEDLVAFLENVAPIIYPDEEERPDFDAIRFSPNEERYGLGFDGPKSVWKLARIIDGHTAFFAALAEFLAAGNELVVVKGNHDPEFTYAELRRYLVDRLNRMARRLSPDADVTSRVFFSPWFYYEKGLFYAEHGGQYDDTNRFTFYLDPVMLYGKTGARTIRFPLFGSSFVRYFFNDVERQVPFADNIRPQAKALFWIITREPGLALLKFPSLVRCIAKTVRKKVFHGFDLLALKEMLKSERRVVQFALYLVLGVAGLFFVRRKHREEYRANKQRNLRVMGRLAGADGARAETGDGGTSDLRLPELARIYYGSFGERPEADDDEAMEEAARALGEDGAGLDSAGADALDAVIARIRAAAKPKPRIAMGIVKALDYLALAVLALVFAGLCVYYGDFTLARVAAFLVLGGLSFYVLHDLKGDLLARYFDAEPERYLNKAAAGVAHLLGPRRARFVIFGHTHVAYARPVEDGGEGEDRRPSQWELNTGSWTPVFDERMMLRRSGEEFPFVEIVTEKAGGDPDFKLLHWNDELGEPQRIRFTGES
ncbi:MAG: hypothetical protein PVH29_09465 [Candidatus Zixiibacteriota bacterium]|jgi:UDP-2,3-diacylglucosamine pyrophosphatase LpxH